jgi:uncharacterized integral membrane protein (TIGR00698 family)
MTAPPGARTERLTGPLALVPGLALAIAIAVAARLLTTWIPSVVADVTVAILLGLLVGRLRFAQAATLRPGLRFSTERLLRVGIVLLGARLSIEEIARIGIPSFGLVVVTMTAAFCLVVALARLAGVERGLTVLLAVGAAVCGNSAVIATAPVIGARAKDVAYAVATVTLFGTAAVFAYPLIGRAIPLGDAVFGLWSGVAINDTSQVIAASSAFSPAALEVATVVKLIRNALMAPLLLGIAWVWVRQTGASGDTRAGVRRAFPLFVLGFLALAALRGLGIIGPDLAAVLDVASRWLILVALAALGVSVRLDDLRSIGPGPLIVGLGAAVLVGIGSLALIVTLGLGAGVPA